jgi:acetyl esterase/lipase
MRAQDYPEQDATSAVAAPYRDACIAASFGVPFAEYRYGPNPYQSIAVYPAPNPTGELFAFIHGGGWTTGYKEWMGFMAPSFTQQGITFASIGYRLAPLHVFPAGLDDCATAVKFLYQGAASFGCQPEKLFLGGHSAGGHYAALLAVRRDWQMGLNLPTDVLKGCLPISGVYRFGENSGLSMRPRFLGPEGNGADAAASPVLHIQDRPPPFFIACGEQDFPHLVRQSEEMTAKLRAAGGTVTSLVMEGRTHFTASLAGGEPDGPWVRPASAFIRSL